MKNILAENMLRFGPKNLSESEKRKLTKLVEQGADNKTPGVNSLKKLTNISLAIPGGLKPGIAARLKMGPDWINSLWGPNLVREPGSVLATKEPSPNFGTDLNGVTGNCYIIQDRFGKSYYVIGKEVSGTIANPVPTGKTVIYKFSLTPSQTPGHEKATIEASTYPGDTFASTFKNVYDQLFKSNPQAVADGSLEFTSIMQTLIRLRDINPPIKDNEIIQQYTNHATTPWIRDYTNQSNWDSKAIYLNLKQYNLI